MDKDKHVVQGAYVMSKTIDVVEIVPNTSQNTILRQDETVIAMVEREEDQHPLLCLISVGEYEELIDEFTSKGVISRPWGDEIHPVSITRAEFVSQKVSRVKKKVKWVAGIHKEPKDLMTLTEYRDFMRWCEK